MQCFICSAAVLNYNVNKQASCWRNRQLPLILSVLCPGSIVASSLYRRLCQLACCPRLNDHAYQVASWLQQKPAARALPSIVHMHYMSLTEWACSQELSGYKCYPRARYIHRCMRTPQRRKDVRHDQCGRSLPDDCAALIVDTERSCIERSHQCVISSVSGGIIQGIVRTVELTESGHLSLTDRQGSMQVSSTHQDKLSGTIC